MTQTLAALVSDPLTIEGIPAWNAANTQKLDEVEDEMWWFRGISREPDDGFSAEAPLDCPLSHAILDAGCGTGRLAG